MTNRSFETVHTSNAAIFNRLGLSPLGISDGHSKKRLAGPDPLFTSLQSGIPQPFNRRHDNRDSRVYFVKLPASQRYYTVTQSHKATKSDEFTINDDSHDETRDKGGPVIPLIINYESTLTGFNNNGKTAKIYHWNLPLMKTVTKLKRKNFFEQMKKKKKYKKLIRERQHFIHSTSKNSIKLFENENTIKKILLNPNNIRAFYDKLLLLKHTRSNDKRLNYPLNPIPINGIDYDIDKRPDDMTHRKMLRLHDPTVQNMTSNINGNSFNHLHVLKDIISQKSKNHHKKATMSYYAPNLSKTGSTGIHKNFPGNGKLEAFYVMEKSRKPFYYHPLLP